MVVAKQAKSRDVLLPSQHPEEIESAIIQYVRAVQTLAGRLVGTAEIISLMGYDRSDLARSAVWALVRRGKCRIQTVRDIEDVERYGAFMIELIEPPPPPVTEGLPNTDS